jgi:hypothetical protein
MHWCIAQPLRRSTSLQPLAPMFRKLHYEVREPPNLAATRVQMAHLDAAVKGALHSE